MQDEIYSEPHVVFEFTRMSHEGELLLSVINSLVQYALNKGVYYFKVDSAAISNWTGVELSMVPDILEDLEEQQSIRKAVLRVQHGNIYEWLIEIPFMKEYFQGVAVAPVEKNQVPSASVKSINALIESYSLKQLAVAKELEIKLIQETLDLQLESDVRSGRALELLKLLILQKSRLIEAQAIVKAQTEQEVPPAASILEPLRRFSSQVKARVMTSVSRSKAFLKSTSRVLAWGIGVGIVFTIGMVAHRGFFSAESAGPVLMEPVQINTDEVFDENGLSSQGKVKLQEIARRWVNVLNQTPKNLVIKVTVHASPRGRFKELLNGDGTVMASEKENLAYLVSVKKTQEQANLIARFWLGEEWGADINKNNLKERVQVVGVGFEDPIFAGLPSQTKSDDACAPYDCVASHRVEIRTEFR